MPFFTVKNSILHNGILLKSGDLIELNKATADRLDNSKDIVSQKQWARIIENGILVRALKVRGKLKKIQQIKLMEVQK